MYAWKLRLNFNKYSHLFSSLDLEYEIVVFVCSCGSESIVLFHKGKVDKYNCKTCGNTSFLDANCALEHPFYFFSQFEKEEVTADQFDYDITKKYSYDFTFEYDEVKIVPEKVVACYGFKVPYDVDYLRQKVFYKIMPVYSYGFDNKNMTIYDYTIVENKKIFDILEKRLQKLLPQHAKELNIPSNMTRKITVPVAKFFFSYKHFKEFEFYYFDDAEFFHTEGISIIKAFEIISNNIKAKMIKKALYKSYVRQVENSKKYIWKIEYNLIRDIKDNNILRQLLEKMHTFRYNIYSAVNIRNFIVLYQYYLEIGHEKSLINLFGSFIENSFEFGVDTLNEFVFAKNSGVLDRNTKLKSNLRYLHDQLVNMNKKQRYSNLQQIQFSYAKDTTSYEMKISSYTVTLPKTARELHEWGETLHNCLSGYVNSVQGNHIIIFGFKEVLYDKIDFVVEYSKEQEILQASSKYNASLNQHQQEVLTEWLNCVRRLQTQKREVSEYN